MRCPNPSANPSPQHGRAGGRWEWRECGRGDVDVNVNVRTSVLPTPSEIAHGQSPFGMSYAPGKLRRSSVLDPCTAGIREATLTIGTSEWNVNTSTHCIPHARGPRTLGYARPMRSQSRTALPISAATIMGWMPLPPPISSEMEPAKSLIPRYFMSARAAAGISSPPWRRSTWRDARGEPKFRAREGRS